MTRGSSKLHVNASIYDLIPILLFDRFHWEEHRAVLTSLKHILKVGASKWKFGGAYIYWSQPTEGDGRGEVLYCGEAEDLLQRHTQHLKGPPRGGNKFGELSAYFNANPGLLCGLALLVIPPRQLPWLSPPDEPPFLEERTAKQAGEALEGLLLRASINLRGQMPRFNGREDASKHLHEDDIVRFQSLVRFLFDDLDASMDFHTFWIRAEKEEAADLLRIELAKCKGLL